MKYRRILPLSLPLIVSCPALNAAHLYYKSEVAANSWAGSFWSSVPGGPYTEAYVAGSDVVFEANGGTALALTGATTSFASVTANENVNVTASGTIGTGGTVAGIIVASGKNLNFGTQGFSTAAGTGLIKNGDGILTLAGGAYTGGFTLNAGTVAMAGVNGMGAGGALTINGGTIRSNSTNARDLTGKYTGGIAVGGDFTLGDATNNGLLTFSNNMAFGASTRTITANSTAVLGGVISGSAGVGLTKQGAGTLALSGSNAATFSGPVSVAAGTLAIRNAGGLGSGAVTLDGGTLQFDTTAGMNVNNAITTTTTSQINANNIAVTLSGPITISGNTTFRGQGGTANQFVLTNAGGITSANNSNLTFMVDSSLNHTVAGPVNIGSGSFTKSSTATVTLNGENAYTGATLVNGGTLTIAGTAGSILNTSSITAIGTTLNLNNTAGNKNRVTDTQAVNLTNGGNLGLIGNTVADTTETVGAINITSNGTLTVTSATDRITTLAASTINRNSAKATALVRGTGLDQSAATNVARITLADGGASFSMVGGTVLNNAAIADATKDVKIIPWMLGDSTVAGTGNGFATYDSTLGLRVLSAAQTTALVPAYVTAGSPENTSVSANLTLDNTAGITVNSLIFKTAAAALDSAAANPLTVNSGAIATSGNFAYSIGSGFSGVVLGNGDGYLTVPANAFTINSPVNVTGGGGLTKAGGGTLALTAPNTYSGKTTLNAGTLTFNTIDNVGGGASALGAPATVADGTIDALSGTLLYNGSGSTSDRVINLIAPLSTTAITLNHSGTGVLALGSITGTGSITKAGVGTIVLANPSSFTGNIQINGTASANTLRIEHAEALGEPASIKNVTITGSNRQFSILELANNITVDANKTIGAAGKSFMASGETTFGSPVFLRNGSGNNTWLGNILISNSGGAYSIESASGTLTLGDVGTSSVLRNDVAGSTRTIELRGGGDIVINSQFFNNGTALTGINKLGTGTLTMPRTDHTSTGGNNFAVGTTIVENMAPAGSPSSIGAGNTFNFGGTLRHVGSADSTSNRAFGLVGAAPRLESSGAGTLSLTSPTTVGLQTGGGTTVAAFPAGATVLTGIDVWSLFPGLTIAGTGITVGTKIVGINYDTREITIDTPTSAANAVHNVVTISGTGDLNRTLTLGGSNMGDNLLASPLANPSGTGKLSVEKADAGRWILAGNNTYTGNTLVSAGTLLVSGALGNSNTTVSNSAMIGGNGTIGGSLTLDAGANLLFSLTDTLTVNGASVSFGGFSITNLIGLNSSVANGTYSLIDGSADFGTFANVSNFGLANAFDLGGGKSAYFGPGSLNVIVIPEPRAALLGGLGLLALLRRRRASI
jgi:autotransporter-associated beta strand protein